MYSGKTYPDGRRALTWSYRQEILRRDSYVCHLCGKPGADSVDHLVPVSKGGNDSAINLKAAHLSCNMSRGNRDLWGFVPTREHTESAIEARLRRRDEARAAWDALPASTRFFRSIRWGWVVTISLAAVFIVASCAG